MADRAGNRNGSYRADVLARVRDTIAAHGLASDDNAVLLMVSGGSDSVALAYACAGLAAAGEIGAVAMLHVNHKLRGAASDGDAAFVEKLAERLGIPLFMCEVDIAAMLQTSGGNMEAVALSLIHI